MVPSKLRKVPPEAGSLKLSRIGHVEDLEDRFERALAAQVERLGEPDVPGEVAVVPADRVALEDAAVGADPLATGWVARWPVPVLSAPQTSEAG